MRNFRNLRVWQSAVEFAATIYKLTETFPSSEDYILTAQLCRAAISVPSNIAEGASRSSEKEFSRYLEIAIGSAFEIETQLEIAHRIGYLSADQLRNNKEKLTSLQKQINALRGSIR